MKEQCYAQSVDVLYSEATLRERVKELGAQITSDYAGCDLVMVCVLRGSFVFMADLIREINLPLCCEFMGISSYGDSTESTGIVKVTQDLSQSVKDRDVMIVEDIVDTGLSMAYMQRVMKLREPRSLAACVLLDKTACRQVDCSVDYVGFQIPEKFVVGYGLDASQQFRNLPFVGIYNGT